MAVDVTVTVKVGRFNPSNSSPTSAPHRNKRQSGHIGTDNSSYWCIFWDPVITPTASLVANAAPTPEPTRQHQYTGSPTATAPLDPMMLSR